MSDYTSRACALAIASDGHAAANELQASDRASILKHLDAVSGGGEAAPLAHVHFAVSRLYAEVVLLPELQPEEDPDDALQVPYVPCMHACMHMPFHKTSSWSVCASPGFCGDEDDSPDREDFFYRRSNREYTVGFLESNSKFNQGCMAEIVCIP